MQKRTKDKSVRDKTRCALGKYIDPIIKVCNIKGIVDQKFFLPFHFLRFGRVVLKLCNIPFDAQRMLYGLEF